MNYELTITEKTFVGDDYCFSIVDSPSTITVSICSRNEYDSNNDPTFFLADILEKEKGYTLEKVVEMIHDNTYVFDAIKNYIDVLTAVKDSREHYKKRRINYEALSPVCCTLEEAAELSHIGISRIQKESRKWDCPWTLWVSQTKRVVKLDRFRDWVNQISSIE